MALIVVVAVAGYVLYRFWSPHVLAGETSPATTNPQAAAERARDLEVVKICLQVIGVGVISAILGFVATRFEAHRREHREAFEIRTELLDRSTRCAQTMYVACQHQARMKTEHEPNMARGLALFWPRGPGGADPLGTLHDAYWAFASEARAIQALIGARYTTGAGSDAAAQRSGFPWDEQPAVSVGDSWWRWHQLYDLLTVYYFSLIRDYRDGDKVLRSNELRHHDEYHSGLALDEITSDSPSDRLKESPRSPGGERLARLWAGDEYDRMARFVRLEFETALPLFVDALRIDALRKDT